MRSFAVIAGLAASAQAYAYGYPAYNTSSAVETPAYPASTPVYATSSAPSYPVESSSKYEEEYPVTTTKVVEETTFVCPEPTTITYEHETYPVTASTVLTISKYTTTYEVKPSKTPEAEKSSSKPAAPVYSASVPVAPTYAPYPSKNATVSAPPQGTATGYPTSTKPATPEFTGAAAQAGVGLLAVVGALAAFL